MVNPLTLLKTTKVEIIGYKDSDFKSKIGSMKLQINPDSISHSHSVNYAGTQEEEKSTEAAESDKHKGTAAGAASRSILYFTTQPETISFSFILDATGVIPDCESVMDTLKEFRKYTYKYIGEKHQPAFVELVWGKAFKDDKNRNFRCRLTSLSVNHKLFKPSGTPLRSELSVSFSQYLTEDEIAKTTNRSSPDMTHQRVVKVGENLPMMCLDVYGDSRYYLDVARFNGLNSIFNIKPGQKIFFPPLEQ